MSMTLSAAPSDYFWSKATGSARNLDCEFCFSYQRRRSIKAANFVWQKICLRMIFKRCYGRETAS